MTRSIFAAALLAVSVFAADVVKSAEHARQANRAELANRAQEARTAVPQVGVTLEQIAALPSVKAHRYVPLKVKRTGELFSVFGYFDVPGRLETDKHRKVYADMYLSQNLDVAVYGQGYNVATGSQYINTDLDSVDAAVALTIGHGPRHFYLVSDPHCPFCTQLEKELERFADAATFHIILIALPMHKQAPDAIRCVLSKPLHERGKALLAIADKQDPCSGESLNAALYDLPIEKAEDAASMLRVTGTPALFTADGMPYEINELARLAPAVEPGKVAAK